jgi:hypothetical protein
MKRPAPTITDAIWRELTPMERIGLPARVPERRGLALLIALALSAGCWATLWGIIAEAIRGAING